MKKKALLIGINRYRIPGADLRGCVNDVEDLRDTLIQAYGFSKTSIAVLTDFAATKKAMQSAIRRLLAGVRAGDVLVLHYSGHGSNVPDNDGDEADRRDEILCPTDLDWKNPLRDDWLRQEFDPLAPGVNLTVIMDCCHSGTNTRAILPVDAPARPRFLPCPWDLVAAESGRPLRGQVVGQLRRSSRSARRQRDVVPTNTTEMLITGCRDTQTSADAFLDGDYHGALTYHLVKALKDAHGQLSYRELHQQVITRLKRAKFAQVPQLEGLKTRFDQPFLAPWS